MAHAFITQAAAIWHAQLARHPKRTALVAGLILPLSFAPFFLLPVFYLSYAAIFQLLLAAPLSLRRAFVLGWLFGFGQFFTGLIWMGEAFLVEAEDFLWALPFAITLLPAGLALFPGVAALAARYAMQLAPSRMALSRMAAALALVLAFGVAAYLRATVLTGLPWNLPAMGWASWLYLAQPVAFIGVHGLGVLALLSAALLALARRRMVWLGLALPLAVMVFSAWHIHSAPQPAAAAPHAGMKIILIQPHIAQREKWQADKRDAHIDKIFRLTRLAHRQSPEAQLVVWPETAVPALIDEGSGFADRWRALFDRHAAPPPYLVTGAVRRESDALGHVSFYNSAFLWSGDGLILDRSDKHHLVPFGEYLPLQNWLEAIGLQQLTRLRGGYASGPPQARLRAARLPLLAPLICYEAIFPHLSGGAPRPAVLLNLTNDGWFGRSIGPHQHLAQARLRAIEQGVPLLRSANTGISAGYDGRGRLLDKLGLGETGSLALTLPAALPETFYARFGDIGFAGLCGFLLMGVIYFRRQKLLPSAQG